MGGVAVLHPQDSLKDHHPHPTPMKSHTYTNTPNFIVSDSRRRTSTKGTRKKNNSTNTQAVAEPDRKMLSKPIEKNNRPEFFAGSAFVDSPPPSSVPLPGFFTKSFVATVRVDPTTDLRRILGLSLS